MENDRLPVYIQLVKYSVVLSFAYWKRGDYVRAIEENKDAKTILKFLWKLHRSCVIPPPLAKSSTNDGILPDKLIKEILLRLSAKNLMRLKSVSKKWHSLINSLINNPYFSKLHQKRSNLKLNDEVEIYTEIGENIFIFLENQNYAAAYKESCRYNECLKAIPKGFTFDRGSRRSVCASVRRRFSLSRHRTTR
ncbi:uncharacterized protein LOC111241364 [Vigna radiata var. radiata]|uniref:Uncharacterized protein LOC111241364 n=1 Tax=Vigna radiata var. radiata TaxID=3916 RepID=A0A3Q0ESI7_VIGRR|nr:uncharacterized protein LOC111241364 [Vigna radiata var. radiata]